MALRYHTSKLEDFGELSKVETYGFRGEALNSICAVSESTQIITKTSKDPVAISYSLDRTGKIVDSKPVGITQGTTVVVTMLFSHVPVRRQTAQRNSAKVGKAVQNILTTYALAHPHIRFFLKLIYDNATKLNFKAGEWILPSMKSPMQLLNELYGVEFTNNVEFVVWDSDKENSLEIENENYDILDGTNSIKSRIVIEAILPKPDAKPHIIFKNGQSFIYLNNRPVIATRGEIKNIVSMVKSTYTDIACKHGWTANKKTPFMWINIKLPTYDYDINVEPSKNVAFFHQGERILSAVENLLINVYGSCQNMSSEKEYSVEKISKAGLTDLPSNLSPISSELLYLSSNEPSFIGDIVAGSSSIYQRSPETMTQNDPELVILDTDDLNESLSESHLIDFDKNKGKMTDRGSLTSQVSDQVTKKKVNKEKRNDVKVCQSLKEWYQNAQSSDVPTTLSIVGPSSTPLSTNNLQYKDRKGSKNTMSSQNDLEILPQDSISNIDDEHDFNSEFQFQNNKSNENSNQGKQSSITDFIDISSDKRNNVNSTAHNRGSVRKLSALDDDAERIRYNMQEQFNNEISDDVYHEDENYARKRTRTDDSEDIETSINTIDSSSSSYINETQTELENNLESISTDIVNTYEPKASEYTDTVNVYKPAASYTNAPEKITIESEDDTNTSEQLRHEPMRSKISPKKQQTLPKQESGVRTIVIGQPTIDDLLRSKSAVNVPINDDFNKSQESSKRKAVQDARKALGSTDTLNQGLKLMFDKQNICHKKKSLQPFVNLDVSSSITCLSKMDCGLWALSRKLNNNSVNLLIVHGERIRELATLQTLVTSTELLPTRKLSTPIDMKLELLGSDCIIPYLKSLSYDQIPDENGAGVWWNMVNQKCITANGVKVRWREDDDNTYVQITHISPLILFASAVDYFSNLMQHLATNNSGSKDVSLASTRSWQTLKILAGEAKQLVRQEDAKVMKRDNEMWYRIKEHIVLLLRRMPNFGNGISYVDFNDREPPLVMVERKNDDEIWYNGQIVVKLLW
ncbi:2156_t:CDS:10, partial [Scutellospora calospora]